MCPNRIDNGDAPACTAVCPTDVMKFGRHEDLLREAKAILARDRQYLSSIYSEREVEAILSRNYIQHIYGEQEAGGTLWIYLSDKPFEELGFRMNVPTRAIPDYTENFMKWTPRFGAIWFVILSCLYIFTKRRADVKKKQKEAAQAEAAAREAVASESVASESVAEEEKH